MKKTILLGMPPVSGLHKRIEANLIYHGFNVINITECGENFRYPSLASHLYVKWRKIIHKDHEAKRQLKWKTIQSNILKKIQELGGLDYALFISGDIFTKEFLQFIRQHSRNGIVNYQFDGLHRFPNIYRLIDEFDRFYVFDPEDLQYSNQLLPATNFYFDDDLVIPNQGLSDFYFTGVHFDSRIQVISNFCRYIEERKFLNPDINILINRKVKNGELIYSAKNISFIDKILDFRENVNRAKATKILVDFVINEHQGLSFRTFEALGYRKKLITTNYEVKKYDFYHPNNILAWDGKSFDELDHFISLPFQDIHPLIREKYGFLNWINYVLDIQPNQKIDLPSQ